MCRFRDKVTDYVEFLTNDDGDLAWNPLAVFKAVKYLMSDFDVVKKEMMRNCYGGKYTHNSSSYPVYLYPLIQQVRRFSTDIIPKMVEEKAVIFPDEDHLYGAIRDFVLLRKALNLTAYNIVDGNAADLLDNRTLTRKYDDDL